MDLSYAEKKNLTPYDVLIIASMVQREVQVAKELPLVAAVIYNRLSRGEPLGIDATTRYEYNNWTDEITQDQLDKDTPYNTRLNAGLTPTPIGNPGLAAIKAAASPAKVNYLFYVVKPGTCPRALLHRQRGRVQPARRRVQQRARGRGRVTHLLTVRYPA